MTALRPPTVKPTANLLRTGGRSHPPTPPRLRMSLFERPSEYRWRETYFVLFKSEDRPLRETVEAALRKLDKRYELDMRVTDSERFESCTLISPHDFAAMDITYIEGEEVREHIEEVLEDLRGGAHSPEEKAKIKRVPECDARFDVYHFEQVDAAAGDEEEEFFDPGSVLIVMERLAEICNGVAVDPQSGSVM